MLAILIIAGCSDNETFQGSIVNFYGGNERNNNYEEWGDFYKQYFVSEKINSKDSSAIVSPVLALSSWQYVLATVNGKIIYVNNKKVEWEQKLEAGFVCASGMVADKEQNIYIIDNNATLYSFSLQGKLRWKLKHTQIDDDSIITLNDLLAQEDGIVASSTDGVISKYTFSGKLIWTKKFNLQTTEYFASDNDANLFIPLTHNRFGDNDTLISLNKKANFNWKKTFKNTRIIKAPVLFEENIFICCVSSSGETKQNKLLVLDKKTGKQKRIHNINQTPRFLSVDGDGNYYLIAYDGGFGKTISTVINWEKDGKKLWDKYFEVTIPYPIMISTKSLAFVGVDKEASGIYFLTKKGLIQQVVSLTEAPTILFQPTVAPGNKIVFGSTEQLGLVYIEDSPLKKYIPW